MDYSNEDNLETNWVFVEHVDIAEEALGLNPSEKHNEDINYSQESLTECLTTSCSDSQLVNQIDPIFDNLNKLSLDHDSESDGLSIISNWSYSQGSPEEDNTDNRENNGKQIWERKFSYYINVLQTGEDKETQTHDDVNIRYENDEKLYNVLYEIDVENEIIEDVKDDMHSSFEGVERDADECFKGNEVEDNLDFPERSFPVFSEERILQYEPNLLDQLKWLDKPPERIEEVENENILQKLFSKIPEGVQKNVCVTGFLIGTVLIAASSIFLGRYFTITETIQDDLPTYQDKGFLYDVPNEENFDVKTALSFCREKHRSNNIYMEINTQKCLSKIEKRLKCKKHNIIIKERIETWKKYLEAKEKFLIEKEQKLRRQEAQFRCKEKNGENDEFEKKNKYNNFKTQKADLNKKKYRCEDSIKEHMQNQNYKDDFKEKKIKVREDVKLNTKIISEDNKNLKHKKEKHHRNTSGKINKQRGDIYKMSEFQIQENDNTILKTKNNEYFFEVKLAKQDKGKDPNHVSKANSDSCQKNKKGCNDARNKYTQNYEPNLFIIDRNNKTVDSDWLSKLFRGRSDLRSKNNIGEWYFDRSSYRKRKRDKAKWYFDWMMNREILRYRRLYL